MESKAPPGTSPERPPAAMSSPAMPDEMPELEMDKILEECGLLEDGMTILEKRELIQTLEVSKISAQTEEDFRLEKEEEISVLPSSPSLQRRGPSVAGTSASCSSPAEEPSPLIGGAPLAQRRRPLRVPPSPGRVSGATDSRQQSSHAADSRQQPPESTDSPGRATASSEDESPVSEPAVRVRRRSAASKSSSEEDAPAPRADDAPQSQPALASEAEPVGSPPRPTQHYVNHEGRRKVAERSERAVLLLELLSEDRSTEDNVRRVLKHLELEQERMLADAEERPWPEDILPSRNFQETSLPPPLDAVRLVYGPRKGAGQRRPSTAPESSTSPSPDPLPVPPPREPAESGGLQVADASRQHSRANQLLQRSIGTHSVKKPSAAPKLSLKLSSRPRADRTAAPDRGPEPERELEREPRPGTSGGSAPALPLLPSLSAGDERRRAEGTPAGRRRPASPPTDSASSAKQARRRPSVSEEIRPAPLRLPRRRGTGRTERPDRAMVPLVTRVQTPGGPSKRPAPADLPAAVSSSSDEDSSPAAAAGSRAGTNGRPGPSTAGAGTSSGASVSAAAAGASAAPGAAGDSSTEQQIQCPLCAAFFPRDKIEAHASHCDGEDVLEIEESPSPPLRRSTATASRTARERTPRGQQRCRLCSELYEEGAAYLEHVDECLWKRRQSNGGEGAPVPEDRRLLTVNGGTPARGDPRWPTDPRPAEPSPAGPTAGSGFSPTFQRISAQTNSCIDYHNQFPVASGRGGGGGGRKRAVRGRRRRGRARGKGRRS